MQEVHYFVLDFRYFNLSGLWITELSQSVFLYTVFSDAGRPAQASLKKDTVKETVT